MGAMAAALCLTSLSPMGAHGAQIIPEVCDCSISCADQAFKTLVKYPQLRAGDVLNPGHKFGVKHPNSRGCKKSNLNKRRRLHNVRPPLRAPAAARC